CEKRLPARVRSAAAAACLVAAGAVVATVLADSGIAAEPAAWGAADERMSRAYAWHYLELTKTARPAEREMLLRQLRREQVVWLNRRDRECGLGTWITDRYTWDRELKLSEAKRRCHREVTDERVHVLTERIPVDRRQEIREHLPTWMAPHMHPVILRNDDDAHAITTITPLIPVGKRYFEVEIDADVVALDYDVFMFIGLEDIYGVEQAGVRVHFADRRVQGVRAAGGAVAVQPKRPRFVVGVAADFDTGRVYPRLDGDWLSSAPGAVAGAENLVPDIAYRVLLSMERRIRPLMKRGAIVFNTGEKPFVHPMPAGYVAMDTPGADGVGSPPPMAVDASERYPVREAVADGRAMQHWIKTFWRWYVRDRQTYRDHVESMALPSNKDAIVVDTNPFSCHAELSKTLWALTEGLFDPPRDVRPERCVGRPGAAVRFLVPVGANFAFGDAATKDCSLLRRDAALAPTAQAKLTLQVDGRDVPVSPDARFTSIDCVDLGKARDGSRSIGAYDGYWLMLEPLSPGVHTVVTRYEEMRPDNTPGRSTRAVYELRVR
ncbi:MAG: DUF1311 domain-containing protein, partial [Burkholderiales bacterium]|nr:DUF1311 domain-containing protein [Burkholderiales bacterium]